MAHPVSQSMGVILPRLKKISTMGHIILFVFLKSLQSESEQKQKHFNLKCFTLALQGLYHKIILF